MNQKYQLGAIRASVLVNFLLGIGIVSAVVFLLFSNNAEVELPQPVAAMSPVRPTTAVPPPPLDEKQIDKLKSNLEIETLKLERLRVQTEKVRASQRRAQAVAPEPLAGLAPSAELEPSAEPGLSTGIEQAGTPGLNNDNPE